VKIEIAYKRENEQDFFNFEVDSGESDVCYKTNSQWDVWIDAIPAVKIDGHEISLDRLRELARAEHRGLVVIIGKAFKEPNGMYTTLFYKNGLLMARTDATAEESEANALAEKGAKE
jgi:hypothetical protein